MSKDFYFGGDRFEIPPRVPVKSPYDIPTEQIQDLIGRDVGSFQVFTIDLATPGFLKIPAGRGLIAYGWESSTPLLKPTDTTFLLQLFLNKDPGGLAGVPANGAVGFPLKHARGFRGVFAQGFIYWTAQAGISVDVVIFTGEYDPIMNGEAAT